MSDVAKQLMVTVAAGIITALVVDMLRPKQTTPPPVADNNNWW